MIFILRCLACICACMYLFSCNGKEIDIVLPAFESKLVVEANFAAGESFSAFVSQSVPLVGVIEDSLQVSNANVWIWKDGQPYCQLTETTAKGNYTNKDCVVNANSTYELRVKAQGFPETSSAPVWVPSTSSSFRFEHIVNSAGIINAHSPQDEFRIWLTEGNKPDEQYYLIGLKAIYADDNVVFNQFWASVSDATLNEPECSTLGYHSIKGQSYSYFLVKGNCLPGHDKPLTMYLQFEQERKVKAIEIIQGRVSEEYFILQKLRNRRPEGMDLLFVAPDVYKSNIRGGYGQVSATASTTITIQR